jgi:hypothetical protein
MLIHVKIQACILPSVQLYTSIYTLMGTDCPCSLIQTFLHNPHAYEHSYMGTQINTKAKPHMWLFSRHTYTHTFPHFIFFGGVNTSINSVHLQLICLSYAFKIYTCSHLHRCSWLHTFMQRSTDTQPHIHENKLQRPSLNSPPELVFLLHTEFTWACP